MRYLIFIVAMLALCSCRSKKAVVTETVSASETVFAETTHTQLQTADSVARSMAFTFDSLIVSLETLAPDSTVRRVRMAAYRGAVKSQEERETAVSATEDTELQGAATATVATSSDEKTEQVGVVKPANGTAVAIAIIVVAAVLGALVYIYHVVKKS